MKKIINNFFWILLIINLFLYLPGLFEPISYGDECIYLTLGNAFKKGLVFYRDIHDNKPPMLYLLAALSNGNLPLFRMTAIVANLLHLFFISKIISLFTPKKWLIFFGSALFSIGLLIFEGRIANGELFMMLPVTIAIYLILKHPKKQTFRFNFFLGLLFSLGFLFKVPVAFDLIGIIFARYFLQLTSLKKKESLNIFKKGSLWGIIFGFALPVILSIIYYTRLGAFSPYVRSALLQNIGYLSSWGGNNSGLIVRTIILIILVASIFIFRKKIPQEVSFFFAWFIFSLFGALLSGRPYPHYLIEILPSFTLLLVLALKKCQKIYFLSALSAIALLTFAFFSLHFWWYPQIPYYQNFIAFIIGKKTLPEYLSWWGQKTVNDYQLSKIINNTLLPEEKIFIWGDGACLYAITKRVPPGRYVVNYHIFDFNGFKETAEAISKSKPKMIIKLSEEKRNWEELDNIIERDYRQINYPKIYDQIFIRKINEENHTLNQ